jgi:hypothetical protein
VAQYSSQTSGFHLLNQLLLGSSQNLLKKCITSVQEVEGHDISKKQKDNIPNTPPLPPHIKGGSIFKSNDASSNSKAIALFLLFVDNRSATKET